MEEFKVDFIGIGTGKAGTKWLSKMLDAHPMICMAEPREVHFFHDVQQLTSAIHSHNFGKGLSWYKQFFQHCKTGQIKGEITPKYFIDPVVPERIKSMFPEAKLILCMRAPVQRATSHYYFERDYLKSEKKDISTAIREEPEYVQNGLYYQGIQRFLAHFPIEQMHFIWFEDIIEHPEDVLNQVYTFLGVDPSFKPEAMHQKSNEAKMTRMKWFREIVATGEQKLTVLGLSPFVRLLKKWKVNRFLARLNSRKITYGKVNEEDRKWLIEQFREDVLALQQMTGRDLRHWLE
jgi:hypothetical protein